MNIEVKGVNFINKGAELMLRSIINEFEDRNIDAHFCMNLKDIAPAPDELNELYFYPWRYSKKIPFLGKSLNFLFEKAKISRFRSRKVMTRDEIDVILDASGFVYSDQWGPESAEVMAEYYREAKQKGQKVILLPQAFGPFESQRLKIAIKKLVQNTDFIYARDRVSFDCLKEVIPAAENISMAPDFTIKSKPEVAKKLNKFKNRVCIIPNYRMVDMRSSGNYLDFLNMVINYLGQKEIEFFFLIHEKDKDRSLVNQLEEKNNERFEIIFRENPLDIKAVIGSSKFVIASRFHGIVGALTQNIPAIATGWSHKYKMLYQEYDLEALFIDDLQNNARLTAIIDHLGDTDYYKEVQNILKKENSNMLNRVNNMWDNVISIL